MTVCIAAICCDDDGSPRFVLCSDKRIESSDAGGDVCQKLDHAGGGWIAMISGFTSSAREFVATIRSRISDVEAISAHSVFDELAACVQIQHRKHVENYVQSRLAVSYDYLLEHGEQFPEDIRRQIFWEIPNLNLGCDIILAGFIEKVPHIYTILSDGSVRRAESFAVVGSGATIAEAALFRRKHLPGLDIETALYHVYEAKRLSEIAPGVGPETSTAVVKLGETGTFISMIHTFADALLDGMYKKFGPQSVDKTEPNFAVLKSKSEGKLPNQSS